jgi:hypothetical protein
MPPELSSGRTIAEFADVSACAETILLKREWAAGLGRNAETALQQTECPPVNTTLMPASPQRATGEIWLRKWR